VGKYINIGNNNYEVYLSSNGVIMIEDLLGMSLAQLEGNKLGFKSIIVMLCGCLWQKNKLSLDQTGDLFDEMVKSGRYQINDVNEIIKTEIECWSKTMKNSNIVDDKKK
jgi:hypothetical protein